MKDTSVRVCKGAGPWSRLMLDENWGGLDCWTVLGEEVVWRAGVASGQALGSALSSSGQIQNGFLCDQGCMLVPTEEVVGC